MIDSKENEIDFRCGDRHFFCLRINLFGKGHDRQDERVLLCAATFCASVNELNARKDELSGGDRSGLYI